jgi:hypothetical protein
MPSALQLGGPHLSLTFAILAKGRCFLDLWLKASFTSQSEFVRCKNKLILRGAIVGGLHLSKVLNNTTNMFSNIIYCHRKLRLGTMVENETDLKGKRLFSPR